MNAALVAVVGFTFAAVIVCVVVYMYFFRLWFSTHLAGAPVPVTVLLRMPFRKVVPSTAIEQYLRGVKAGVRVSIDDIQEALASGGDIREIMSTLIAAKASGRTLDFGGAFEMNLDSTTDVAQESARAGD